jgi:hypothetical protein
MPVLLRSPLGEAGPLPESAAATGEFIKKNNSRPGHTLGPDSPRRRRSAPPRARVKRKTKGLRAPHCQCGCERLLAKTTWLAALARHRRPHHRIGRPTSAPAASACLVISARKSRPGKKWVIITDTSGRPSSMTFTAFCGRDRVCKLRRPQPQTRTTSVPMRCGGRLRIIETFDGSLHRLYPVRKLDGL